MKTEWDYTSLADAYLERPDYAPAAIIELLSIAGVKKEDKVCDIGAGVAHLTIPLAEYGCIVEAVEPNDAMRANGMKRTANFSNVSWFEGTGENTTRESGIFDFVTFGSSFNVCDRQKALQETYRLLKPKKYFACLWNHRDLNDTIQKTIEEIIRSHISNYEYGTRRENQTDVINASGLFINCQYVEGTIRHVQKIEKVIEAWCSHATLERQAKDKFYLIIQDIEKYLKALHVEQIEIPYTTRAWIAQRKE